jgi:glycosyltransferase involved in cell wall biosynthesis
MSPGPDMILIDAAYINAGGGKVLLQELLLSLRGVEGVCLLRDIRVEDVDTMGFQVYDIPANERARTKFYRKYGQHLTRVLCFGNVPPPIRLDADVAVYFHNMLLCQTVPEVGWVRRIMAALKMTYIRLNSCNADRFLVQSEAVLEALAPRLPAGTRIEVMAFYTPQSAIEASTSSMMSRWGKFAYVSNAYPHKNHRNLIQAWALLARRGLFPELHLTISGHYPEIYARIEEARAVGAKIINHGFTEPARLYQQCGYQIFPSLLESFGLGLVEAAESGCAIIAADLPYVYQVVKPTHTFDPHSPESICEVVALASGKQAPAAEVIVVNQTPRIVSWLLTGLIEAPILS